MRSQSVRSSRKAGFRRLWLVLSVIWLLATIAMSWDDSSAIKVVLLAGVLPSAALYALGVAVAWVIEGFAKAE